MSLNHQNVICVLSLYSLFGLIMNRNLAIRINLQLAQRTVTWVYNPHSSLFIDEEDIEDCSLCSSVPVFLLVPSLSLGTI